MRLQLLRPALLRLLPSACADCHLLRLYRASSPSTCVSGASTRLILRANLRLSSAYSAGSIIVLRSPLALQASFRDHPSDSSFRLSDCTFVRFCFPIVLRLAPLPNRSASFSARRQLAPPTKPPTLLSCSPDQLAPIVQTFRPHLPPRRQLAPPNGLPILLSCSTRDLRPSSSFLASSSITASACAFDASPILLPDRSPACAFVQPFRLTFRTADQLAPPAVLPDLPSCPHIFSLRRTRELFSLAFHSSERLAPSIEFPALPSCLIARLAPCDRPFSLTFLPDCQFPGCLPPPALPSVFSSALASGSAAGPSFRFELPTLTDCRLSGPSI